MSVTGMILKTEASFRKKEWPSSTLVNLVRGMLYKEPGIRPSFKRIITELGTGAWEAVMQETKGAAMEARTTMNDDTGECWVFDAETETTE